MIKRLILLPFKNYPHLMMYWCFGFITAGIDVALFTLMVEILGVYYIKANCISVFLGICVSYYLNSKFNFKVTDHPIKRLSLFLGVGLTGIALSNFILYFMIEYAHLFYFIGKITALVSVSLCKFTVNKFVTFKT